MWGPFWFLGSRKTSLDGSFETQIWATRFMHLVISFSYKFLKQRIQWLLEYVTGEGSDALPWGRVLPDPIGCGSGTSWQTKYGCPELPGAGSVAGTISFEGAVAW